MGLFAAISIGSGLLGASSARKAGKAAMQQARMQAAEIRKQRFDISELATQQHLDRSMQFKELQSQNTAMAAFMGRSDRSIQASSRYEGAKYSIDVQRLREQERRDIAANESQARQTEAGGKMAQKQYNQQATGALFNTALTAAALYKSPSTITAGAKNASAYFGSSFGDLSGSQQKSLIKYGEFG